jgi:hypothetical protein
VNRLRYPRSRGFPSARQWRLVAVTLLLIVAPVVDHAADAAWGASAQRTLGFDLCTVTGVILADLTPLSRGESSPLSAQRTLPVPPAVPRVADHPPRFI